MTELEVGDSVTARYKDVGYTGRIVRVDEKHAEAVVSMAPGVEMLFPYEDITKHNEGATMAMTAEEAKDAAKVASDLDLMIRARELTGASDSIPSSKVLEEVHASYSGGITQFYLANRF